LYKESGQFRYEAFASM